MALPYFSMYLDYQINEWNAIIFHYLYTFVFVMKTVLETCIYHSSLLVLNKINKGGHTMSKMLHTCVRVENLEESIRFYEEAFGFKETRRKDFPEHKFTIAYLAFEGDDYELELTYNYGHGPYEIGDGYGHIAISAKDLEALHAEHVAKGYDVTELKGLPGHPANYYFVKDLDGYKIEVIREK